MFWWSYSEWASSFIDEEAYMRLLVILIRGYDLLLILQEDNFESTTQRGQWLDTKDKDTILITKGQSTNFIYYKWIELFIMRRLD